MAYLHRSDGYTLLERAAFKLGWALDVALTKPREWRAHVDLDLVCLRNAFRDGYHRVKPGQYGYVGAASAQYAAERAEAQNQNRQVA